MNHFYSITKKTAKFSFRTFLFTYHTKIITRKSKSKSIDFAK